VKDENSINFDTVKKILLFWGLTVPVAMAVAYGITALLLIGQPIRIPPPASMDPILPQ
jgi:phosphate/sulfate permease